MLKPGGALVVADFAKHDQEAMRKRYGDRWLGFEAQGLASLLARAGFDTLDTSSRPVGNGLEIHIFSAVKRECKPDGGYRHGRQTQSP